MQGTEVQNYLGGTSTDGTDETNEVEEDFGPCQESGREGINHEGFGWEGGGRLPKEPEEAD